MNYQCHECKSEHTTGNVTAVCIFCFQKAEKEIAELKQQLVAEQAHRHLNFTKWDYAEKELSQSRAECDRYRSVLEVIRDEQWQEWPIEKGGPIDATDKERGLFYFVGRVHEAAKQALSGGQSCQPKE